MEQLKLLVAKQELQLQLQPKEGPTKRRVKIYKNNNYCWTPGYWTITTVDGARTQHMDTKLQLPEPTL